MSTGQNTRAREYQPRGAPPLTADVYLAQVRERRGGRVTSSRLEAARRNREAMAAAENPLPYWGHEEL